MDMKVQGSRSGKALGIAELLAALVLGWIDHRYGCHTIIRKRKARAAVLSLPGRLKQPSLSYCRTQVNEGHERLPHTYRTQQTKRRDVVCAYNTSAGCRAIRA